MNSITTNIKPFIFLSTILLFSVLLFSCTDEDFSGVDEDFSGADEVQELSKSEDQLSVQEKETLLFMLEEEKMARDVYTSLYEQWGAKVFDNISRSESNHMSAISKSLAYYGVAHEILGHGEFNNKNIKSLYDQLISNGNQSLLNAYNVGATIEDLDIYDLQKAMKDVEKDSIIKMFESLQCGSRNHLRSFTKNIENLEGTYSVQYITPSEYETIINTNNENCN